MKVSVKKPKSKRRLPPKISQCYHHSNQTQIWMRIDRETGKNILLAFGLSITEWPAVSLETGHIFWTRKGDKSVEVLNPINGGQIFESLS